ncbi:MAG: hypothetical protein P8M78_00730 [Myxococcota bacterium]|nr:hypothetical protein [Myxococcota bacterium]
MKVFFLPFAAFSLLVSGLAPAESTPPRSPTAFPRPFQIYLGLEPKRLHSSSPLSGTQVLPPVLQGDQVHHVFWIDNPTERPIEITRVQLCSGCMLEGHSKNILPGARGHLGFVIPTDALGGQTLTGAVQVWTDHPNYSELRAEVSLEVKAFAEVQPYRIWLRGEPGKTHQAQATIIPNPAYPFEIQGVRARKGIWIRWELEKIVLEGRPAFQLNIYNTRTKPGAYQDVLFIQTDHPERPELKLRVEGRIGSP